MYMYSTKCTETILKKKRFIFFEINFPARDEKKSKKIDVSKMRVTRIQVIHDNALRDPCRKPPSENKIVDQ